MNLCAALQGHEGSDAYHEAQAELCRREDARHHRTGYVPPVDTSREDAVRRVAQAEKTLENAEKDMAWYAARTPDRKPTPFWIEYVNGCRHALKVARQRVTAHNGGPA